MGVYPVHALIPHDDRGRCARSSPARRPLTPPLHPSPRCAPNQHPIGHPPRLDHCICTIAECLNWIGTRQCQPPRLPGAVDPPPPTGSHLVIQTGLSLTKLDGTVGVYNGTIDATVSDQYNGGWNLNQVRAQDCRKMCGSGLPGRCAHGRPPRGTLGWARLPACGRARSLKRGMARCHAAGGWGDAVLPPLPSHTLAAAARTRTQHLPAATSQHRRGRRRSGPRPATGW